jgi:hypothetical protein
MLFHLFLPSLKFAFLRNALEIFGELLSKHSRFQIFQVFMKEENYVLLNVRTLLLGILASLNVTLRVSYKIL